jgi:3-hydroxyacyl-CoA dehydrogenase/enoyl-CoA hydratase/3-hydroxybutyryl-CoA epimerase
MDEVGLDIAGKVGMVMAESFGARMMPGDGVRRVVESGRTGRKGRSGFYVYDENGEKGAVDASVYSLIRGEAAEAPDMTPLERHEIVDRCVLAMVNEAVRCLEEGVLRSPRDGDIGAVFGIGFPPFLGGPFRYADVMGAGEIVSRLDTLDGRHGDRFKPADMLVAMARAQKRFYPADGRPV